MGELDGPPKPRRLSNAGAILWAVALIGAGCVTNNFVLELIISRKKNPHADPSAGGLMTFLQFVCVAGLSAPHGFAWRGFGGTRGGGLLGALRGALPLRPRPLVVPFKHYVGMTALFFSMSLLNNAAFAFHISQPLHMVFRSSSLMVTYALGRACFRKRCVAWRGVPAVALLGEHWRAARGEASPSVWSRSTLDIPLTLHSLSLCSYTGQQLFAVVLLTLGALAATAAEALWGDTASAAAASASAATAANATGRALAADGIVTGSPCAGGAGCGDGGALASATAAAAAAARQLLSSPGAEAADADSAAYMLRWAVGMVILVAVLVLQTLLGNYQNWTAATYGRAPQEGMFWSHTLSLPLFLLAASDLRSRGAAWAATPPLREYVATALLPAAGGVDAWSLLTRGLAGVLSAWPLGGVPTMWALVVINAISQYVCVTGVYNLTSVSDPLTVNVTLTVRKSVSLLLSIWAFGNTFTPPHWVGAALVFGGAMLYGMDLGALLGRGGSGSSTAGGGSASGSAPSPVKDGAVARRRPAAPAAATRPAPAGSWLGGLLRGWRRKEKADDDATQPPPGSLQRNVGGGVASPPHSGSGSGRRSYYATRASSSSSAAAAASAAAGGDSDGDATPMGAAPALSPGRRGFSGAGAQPAFGQPYGRRTAGHGRGS